MDLNKKVTFADMVFAQEVEVLKKDLLVFAGKLQESRLIKVEEN